MNDARREYLQRVRDRLDTWNREIEDLAGEIRRIKGDEQEEVRRELQSVREHRDRLQHDVTRLKEVDEDGWGDLSEGVDEAWTRIEEALGRLGERIRGAHG